jgi:predicted glycoside hydrolase/deacetylase ChbG (UPF0249 family)
MRQKSHEKGPGAGGEGKAARTLVVVADDGGSDPARDRGILEAVDAGVVRTVSVLANGPTVEPLAAELRRRPGVSVLLHLNLTEGPALAGASPTLTGPDGKFPGDKQAVWHRAHGGLLDPGAIGREAMAQAARLRALGLGPVGLNGHNHVHVLPGVRDAVAGLLVREPWLRWVRIPSEPAPPPSFEGCVDEPAMPCAERALDHVAEEMLHRGHTALAALRVLSAATVHVLPGRVRFADAFLGFAFGCSGSREVLEASLRGADAGLVELMVHPGRPADAAPTPFGRSPLRDREREVLCDPAFARFLRETGFEPRSVAEALG